MHLYTQIIVFLVLVQILPFQLLAQNSKQKVENWNTKQPSRFTENKGQVTDQNGNLRNDVKYIYSAPGFKAVFKENSFSYEIFTVEKKPKQISEGTGKPADEFLPEKFKQPEDVTIKTHRIDINLPGANPHPQIIAEGKSADYNNYYLAHTPEEGVQKVYSFTKLTYKNIWPNIDIVFYARKEGELKYDIVVNPGGDITNIAFAFNGADKVNIKNGNLSLQTSLGKVQENIPLSYTLQDKQKVIINYTNKKNKIGFSGEYDRSKTLVIDPVVTWLWHKNIPHALTTIQYFHLLYWTDPGLKLLNIDAWGNLYLTGNGGLSVATSGAHQTTYGGGYDAFLAKFNKDGKILWGTYYGGTENDYGRATAIDKFGNVFMAGSTTDSASLATQGAFQTARGGNAHDTDAFIVKFDSSGSRKWATYFGGSYSEDAISLATDKYGNAYLAGIGDNRSKMSTPGTYQLSGKSYSSAFLVKFDSVGNRKWATYYGQSVNMISTAADDSIGVYLAGQTQSYFDISTSGAHQTTMLNSRDGFLVKFDSSGARKWGTFYGSPSNEEISAIATDKLNNVYIAGSTSSAMGNSGTYIATTQTHQPKHNGQVDAFVAKFNSSGVRQWGTFYGGDKTDHGNGLAVDSLYNVYLTGNTNSPEPYAWMAKQYLYTPGAYQDSLMGFNDAFLVKFDKNGKRIWGTYYGEPGYNVGNDIVADNRGNVYLLGLNEDTGMYIVKFNESFPDVGIISLDSIPEASCDTKRNVYVRIKNFAPLAKTDSVYVDWTLNGIAKQGLKYKVAIKAGDTSPVINLGKVTLRTGKNVFKIWTQEPNDSTDDDLSNDTLNAIVNVSPLPNDSFYVTNGCAGEPLYFTDKSTVSSGSLSKYLWKFGDGDTSTLINPVHIYDSAGKYLVVLKVTTDKGCSDSIMQTVTVYPLPTL